MKRLAILVVVVLGSIMTASVARADPETEAKDLFERGKEARRRGDCGGAVPLLQKAHQIFPQGLGTLRNLAECEEVLGHYASARRAWLEMKRALAASPNDPKYEGWDTDADAAAVRLQPKIAQITVDVIVKSPEYEGPANERSGVELLVNGDPLPPNLIGTTLERDPGTYIFRAQAHDAKPVEHSVTVVAGDNKRLALHIVRTPRPIQEKVSTMPAETEQAHSASTRKTFGWIAVGVGGAALVGSLVTFLVHQSAKDEVETQCKGADPCRTPDVSGLQSTIDRGKIMGLLAPTLLTVGAVAAGGGIVLIATAPSAQSARSRFVLRGGLAQLHATWRF